MTNTNEANLVVESHARMLDGQELVWLTSHMSMKLVQKHGRCIQQA